MTTLAKKNHDEQKFKKYQKPLRMFDIFLKITNRFIFVN